MASPNVFSQFLQAPRSVADYQSDMDRRDLLRLQLEGQRGQNALTTMTRQQQMQQAEQSMAERNALQRLAQQFGGDAEGFEGALASSGMPGLMAQAEAMSKRRADLSKSKAEAGKIDAETAAKVAETRYTELDRHARSLGMVQTPQDVQMYADRTLDILGVQGPQRDQARQQMLAKVQELGLDQWKQVAAQQAIPLLEKFKQDADNKRAKLAADTQMRGQDITAATARRGQDMTDARAKDSNAAAVSKPFEVTGPDGVPLLVRQDKAGNITPVEGFQPKGMGTTKLTEDQGKATGWLAQATNAYANMQAAMQRSPGAANPGPNDVIDAVPGLGGVANMMRGADRQQYLQASSSLSEALLRAATGAGVNRDEALQKVRELTPQIGDSAANVKQKMDAIPVYLESLKVRAGPGAKQLPGIMERAKAPTSFADPDKERRYQEWKAQQK